MGHSGKPPRLAHRLRFIGRLFREQPSTGGAAEVFAAQLERRVPTARIGLVPSIFLDNIAGALIGGAMAHQLFRAKVHIGYIAAIVAASNAGGAWSVVGDTTTTMMWIAGVPPSHVFEAIIGASVALFIFGIPAAIQQPQHSPLL